MYFLHSVTTNPSGNRTTLSTHQEYMKDSMVLWQQNGVEIYSKQKCIQTFLISHAGHPNLHICYSNYKPCEAMEKLNLWCLVAFNITWDEFQIKHTRGSSINHYNKYTASTKEKLYFSSF